MYRDYSLLYQGKWNRIFAVSVAFLSSFHIKSYYFLNLSYLNGYGVFLIFPETVKVEEEAQVGPQAQESPHDSSTDSCLTFPYSSDSPRPFPPSPVHSVTDSPKMFLPCPLPLAILPVTILLFTVLLFTTFLLLSYPLFLFPYFPKLSLLFLLLLLLILITLFPTSLSLLVLFPSQVL